MGGSIKSLGNEFKEIGVLDRAWARFVEQVEDKSVRALLEKNVVRSKGSC